jgi:general secretion pathway protein B
MSYILDALKKSEKDRRRGTVPDLLTIQEVTLQKKIKRHLWPYLLAFALILNAGLFIWWLKPWKTDQINIIKQPSVHMEPKELPAEPLNSAIVESEFEPSKSRENASSFIAKNADEADSSQQKQIPLTGSNTSDKKSIKIEAPIKNKIYNFNELPLSIQESLPSLKITISLYSDDPTLRMVKIDDKMLHEGEYMAAGLKLDSITPEEVVFTYEGFRFRVVPR